VVVHLATGGGDLLGDGRKAGPLRNSEMVKNADALIALWDGASNGTRDVIMKARTAGLKVYVLEYDKAEETGGMQNARFW
jgi:hypothetical protein